ncbi:MAG: DUF1761 domain-containing protein [Trueperaceae bacterium]
MDFTVNVWAILVATVVYFALGAGWYMVLSKPWMAALGWTRTDVENGSKPAIFVVTFVLEAIAVFTLAVLVGNMDLDGIGGGASLGALVGIGIWFALLSVTFMYESRKPALFLIDGGYHVVALTAAGAILGAWPPG